MSLQLTKNDYQSLPANGSGLNLFQREIKGPEMVAECDEVDSLSIMDMAPEVSDTSLPILATANDMREVVRFLKNKPSGVTFIEAMNAEPRRIFDARKIAAYE